MDIHSEFVWRRKLEKLAGKLQQNMMDAAIERNREISAPANCIRLNRKTPCAVSGSCEDCKSSDRICNEYTLIKRNLPKGRIKVILLNFEAGY